MNTTVAIDPHATVDLAQSLTTIPITINLTNSPPINGFEVVIRYQYSVLKAASLDYSTNVLSAFSTQFVARYCLDGNGLNGNSAMCQSDDDHGVTSFAMTASQLTMNNTSGTLLTIMFHVNTTAPAFTQIQIKEAALSGGFDSNGNHIQVPANPVDGYYTSLNCGGVPCAPPSADFTWSPRPPKQGTITIFYGNLSTPSTGASITDYFWTFADNACPNGCSTPYVDTKANYTASHLYLVAGNYSVTLQITDSKGVKASKTAAIIVINADVDMGVENLVVEPSPIGLHPGVVFTITAVLHNFGGVPENTNMTLTVAGEAKPLAFLPTAIMKPSSTRTLTATWDSKGKIPNVYRLDFSTPILKNETKTDNNHKSYWIQLIPTEPAGSLSLLSIAGISVLVVGGGGLGVSLLRKRTLNVDDAL